MTDLLALAAELVAIPSESHDEARIRMRGYQLRGMARSLGPDRPDRGFPSEAFLDLSYDLGAVRGGCGIGDDHAVLGTGSP